MTMTTVGRSGLAVAFLLVAAFVGTPIDAQEQGGPHLGLPPSLELGDAGPTLLLFPCAGCGGRSWDRFMQANSDRFRMIAITLPGQDGAPRPQLPQWTDEPVFQDNAIDQVSRLIDERGLREIVVVGHSFGALMAMRVAIERPDVVSHVVNVDGSATNPTSFSVLTVDELAEQARGVVDTDWALRLQNPDRYRSFNGANAQPDEAQRKLHHGMFMASDRLTMLHYWRENLLRDRNPEFRALSVPYLDIEAISPRVTKPDSAGQAYDESIAAVGTPPGYQRVFAYDTSHWVHLEHPRVLGDVILDHVEGRVPRDIGPFELGEVVREGSGTRDVILMPCLGCDASSWDDFMHRNAERYRMVAITWPGLGDTELPDVYDDGHGTPYFDHLMRALQLLIQREGLTRPVLIGHSAAAVAAVRFAAERPDLLGGVVNVDAIVANGDTFGYDREQRRAWADEEMAGVLAAYDDDEAWAELNAAPSSMSPERGTFYERMWLTPPREHVFAWWRDWLRTDAGALLPTLRIPFLAVHALPTDETRASEKRSDLEWRYRRAPLPVAARVVYVENAGHTIWEYQPEAFDRVVEELVHGRIGR
jgi:pimeloyl-ACP methyl ester carboxylesterase